MWNSRFRRLVRLRLLRGELERGRVGVAVPLLLSSVKEPDVLSASEKIRRPRLVPVPADAGLSGGETFGEEGKYDCDEEPSRAGPWLVVSMIAAAC